MLQLFTLCTMHYPRILFCGVKMEEKAPVSGRHGVYCIPENVFV